MDNVEKIALKAACIQAAAILVGPQPTPQPVTPPGRSDFAGRASSAASTASAGPAAVAVGPDTGACARFARDLFDKVTGESWD
jgi:hypothetical protein